LILTERWATITLLAGAFLLYLVTLDNGLQPEELVGGDLITHQYAQVQARPSNAPGYPLYSMGGWLWFHTLRNLWRLLGDDQPNPLPLLSSYSTLWALLSLWLLFRILNLLTIGGAPGNVDATDDTPPLTSERPTQEDTEQNQKIRVYPHLSVYKLLPFPPHVFMLGVNWLLCAFYAVTYFFWYYATTTEQYSSAIAQTLAIVYLFLRWQSQTSTANQRLSAQGERLLLLLALLCGLSLAHMLTVALIVPPVVIAVIWHAPWLLRNGWLLLRVVAVTMLPLSSYVYVYLRGAAHPEWWGAGDWRTAQEWFWAFVSTAQGRKELGWGFQPGRAFFGNQFPELIGRELGIPLLVLGLLGIGYLGRKRTTLLYGALTLYLLFCWAYRYGNWFQVILPAYPLVLIGVGATAHRWVIQRGQQWLGWCALVALVLLVGWRANASWPAANSRNRPEDQALEKAANLLAQPIPAEAHLFGELHDALALQYLIDIWGIRPDLKVVSSPQAAQILTAGKPVLATWQSAEIMQSELPPELVTTRQSSGPGWILFEVGNVVEQTAAISVGRVISEGLVLDGYEIQPTPYLPFAAKTATLGMDVTLVWRILGEDWPAGLALSVRPTLDGAWIPDPSGEAGSILQQDYRRPAHGLLALTDMQRGVPVADAYRFPLANPLPTGANGVLVILYRATATGFENVAELTLPYLGENRQR
jgi:hypothetical protein